MLFLRYQGTKGIGNHILQLSFLRNLDRFSERVNILEEEGNKFHFSANKFKHRFGVNLMRMGLNITQVQNIIANVTPEMPMKYARIFQKEL